MSLKQALTFLGFVQVSEAVDADVIVSNSGDATEFIAKTVSVSWLRTLVNLQQRDDFQFHSPDPAMIFSGFVVAASDEISIHDRAAIFGSVLAFGGQYRTTLAKDVTHFIALTSTTTEYSKALVQSNLPQRFDNLNRNPNQIFTGHGLKIVLPHFFDDCIRVKRRITEYLYSWPDIKILKAMHENSVFGNPNGLFGGAVDKDPGPASKNKEFLKGHLIYFGRDCEDSLVKGVHGAIQQVGGKLAKEYSAECTIVILLKREGSIYVQASRNPTQLVGTPRYIYDCFKLTTLTPPKHKLLHYPAPAYSIPQFKDLKICATNYVGQSRTDIETMVVQLGGTYTRQMTQDNTHVICARPYSEKTKRAKEWDISIVNHLWLEECYRQEKVVNPCRSEYLYYPVCLPRIVGDAFLIPAKIEKSVPSRPTKNSFVKMGGLAVRESFNETEAGIGEEIENTPKESEDNYGQERTNMPRKLSAIKNQPSMSTSTSSTPKVTSSKSLKSTLLFTAAGTTSAAVTGDQNTSVAIAPTALYHKSPVTVYKSKRNSSATPPTPKYLAAIAVDVDPPSDTSSKRERITVQSVTKALNHVENRPNNVGAASKLKQSVPITGVKRGRRSSVGADVWTEIAPANSRQEKKQKLSESIRIICTGGSKIDKALWKDIQNMGGKDAMDIEGCTHLVTNKIVRTEKFITALTLGKEVVSSEWVEKSLKAGRWLDPKSFRPVDETSEYPQFSITTSLERSRSTKLLSGFNIYATPHVSPDWTILKRLVEHAGGKMVPPLSLRKLSTNDIRLFTHIGRPLNSSPLGSDNLPSSSGGVVASGSVVASNRVVLISCEDD
ncbi:hypothetical protein BDR26DRAFT_923516 [Obelidium mucronatum]|nr:hypothetical protein BDR26DRAFT_923516 [Obelidium mucronatum]